MSTLKNAIRSLEQVQGRQSINELPIEAEDESFSKGLAPGSKIKIIGGDGEISDIKVHASLSGIDVRD